MHFLIDDNLSSAHAFIYFFNVLYYCYFNFYLFPGVCELIAKEYVYMRVEWNNILWVERFQNTMEEKKKNTIFVSVFMRLIRYTWLIKKIDN